MKSISLPVSLKRNLGLYLHPLLLQLLLHPSDVCLRLDDCDSIEQIEIPSKEMNRRFNKKDPKVFTYDPCNRPPPLWG